MQIINALGVWAVVTDTTVLFEGTYEECEAFVAAAAQAGADDARNAA